MSQIIDASPNEPGLLARTIRSLVFRHWYWMILIAGISGGVAFYWATANRQISATVSGSLVYRGLPPAFSRVYAPIGVAGCIEYARSVKMMKALTEALAKERGPLSIGPQQLARCFEIHSAGHGSNMIEVALTWGDLEDGIRISNKFMDVFVAGIDEQRQSVLTHQLETIRALAEDEQNAVNLTRQTYQNALARGATRSERSPDRLPRAELLKQWSSAVTAHEDARSSLEGVLKQIDACELELQSLQEEDERITGELRDNLIEEALAALNEAMKPLTAKPSRTKARERLQQELNALKQQKVDTGAFSQWVTELNDRIQQADDFLPDSAVKKIHDDVLGTVDYDVAPIVTLKNEKEAVESRKKQLKLSLAPIESKIELLSKREENLKESLKSAKSVVTSPRDETGVALSEKHQHDEAIRRHRNLAIQQESLEYLMKSTPGGSSVWSEWDVAVYASEDTAVVSSNAKKLFALTFVFCASLLSMPLFLLELTRNMDSPQKVFAHRAGVPLLAERSLNATIADPLPPTDEAVRMIALKIQQARQRGGAVVLFSSLDEEGIAVPVISSVARCLALRGEKVLLVDAVCPERNTHKLSHMMLPLDVSQAGDEGRVAASDSSESGLSDLLHSGESEMELIRRSETPGIDVVDRGSMAFPPEAMASGALSRFFDSQRDNYSIVLAHGPGACSPADMEMLAARSDTVVLVASKNVKGSRTARAVVHDMLEIGAPVLGVISV